MGCPAKCVRLRQNVCAWGAPPAEPMHSGGSGGGGPGGANWQAPTTLTPFGSSSPHPPGLGPALATLAGPQTMAPVVPSSGSSAYGAFGGTTEVELGPMDHRQDWEGGSIGILAPGQREGGRRAAGLRPGA